MFIYIATAILLILPLMTSCDRLETADDIYANYEQVRATKEPGNWIPLFIPRSATDIKGRHKIDSGAQLLTFYFEGDTSSSLGKYCKETTASEIQFPQVGFLDVTWWPPDLVQGDTRHEKPERYKFFHCERQAFLALTEQTGRQQAFYWRISFT